MKINQLLMKDKKCQKIAKYQIIQTIDFYEEQSATVELNNEKLVFSYPFSIYEKIDGKYIFVGGVSNIYSHSLLQIKENEIATIFNN